MNGHQKLEGILDETVHAGLLPRKVADVWLTMANGMHGSDPRLARDEAIRSGSLAAMMLMLAAGNRGLRQLSYSARLIVPVPGIPRADHGSPSTRFSRSPSH